MNQLSKVRLRMVSLENTYLSFLTFVLGIVSFIALFVTMKVSHGIAIKTMVILFIITLLMFAISFIAMHFGDVGIYRFVSSWVEWSLYNIGGLNGIFSA